jgi:hypothetical protein
LITTGSIFYILTPEVHIDMYICIDYLNLTMQQIVTSNILPLNDELRRNENIVLSPLSLPGSSASTIHMHALDIVSIFITKVNVLMVVLPIVFYCCLLNTNIDNYQLMLAFFPCVVADTKFYRICPLYWEFIEN